MLSVGTALPDKVLTNHDLEEMVDTSHQWIVERSGIHERRIGGTTAGLAAEAAQMAIERSGVDPTSIDLLILATTSPDRQVPATASTVQEILGLRCGAMDLNAACSGFVYGLIAAHGFIQMGHNRILVIGAETLSRLTDWTDRSRAFCSPMGLVLPSLRRLTGQATCTVGMLIAMGPSKSHCFVTSMEKSKWQANQFSRMQSWQWKMLPGSPLKWLTYPPTQSIL